MVTKISPKYDSDYLADCSDEKIIDVFEDRVFGWFLDWASDLNQDKEHAGFAVLHLSFSYFEFISIFANGRDSNGKSKDFFYQGFLDVFPELAFQAYRPVSDFLDLMYKNARCGFFHNGMAKRGIMLCDHVSAITIKDGNVFIDRYKFVERIRNHFSLYVKGLRNSEANMIENFKKSWKIVNQ